MSTSRNKHRNVKKRRRHVNALNLWTMILIILVCLEMIVAAFGVNYINKNLVTTPDLVLDDFFSQESSRIFDKDGNQIADVGTQIRENVSYNEMPECLIDAFLAVEDSRYFEHDGFDLPRFTKSAITNVENKLLHRSGLSGGSTFTMQLVKLTYFQNDETGETANRSIEYKIQQIALARELEKKADKKSIFEMYLNKMNFGGQGNIRGVQKAAQYYYGKDVGQLNLPEAAMLAGVINSPYYYDPHNFLDKATERRDTVLYQMYNHGYIDKKEYQLALKVKVEDTLIDPSSKESGGDTYAYQSYIDSVIAEAQTVTGLDPLYTAMDIYTCMDPSVQSVMDGIQSGQYESVVFPDDLMEIGVIAENNQTGEIVGIAGGRNYGRGGSMLLNHAMDQYKQPGSTVKPFLDYALAFEYLGWATDHVVVDRPIAYEDTGKVIQNFNGLYYGEVRLNYAIAASLNTPAIQTFQQVINNAGWQTVADYLASLHFSQIDPEAFDIGYAIGGSNFVVSCEELMAAHAIIMNGGNYIKPHTITKIVYRSGQQEDFVPQYDRTQVLSPQAAWLTAQMMYYTIHGGVYNYLQILDRPYATYGKTGTTDWGDEGLQYNIPQGASKDKWMICDTSQYTITTWVGYEKGVLDGGTWFSSDKSQLNIPGNICSLVLDAVHPEGSYPEEVPMPDGISSITHILGVFPYTAPLEGMDQSLITTGYIKSDYASLQAAPAMEVKELASFDAKQNEDNSITLSWAPYPDADALNVVGAEGTLDISLRDADGNVIVSAYGNKLFDWSWVYGPIRYKARISQNGAQVGDIVLSETEENSVTLENLAPDTDTEACGFYGYEKSDSESNEVCVTFHTAKVQEEPQPSADPSASPTASAEPGATPTPTPETEG